MGKDSIRSRELTDAMMDRCLVEEAESSERALAGSKHILFKYSRCQTLYMEIVQKLVAVALVSVVNSDDGLQLSLAIALLMAAASGMVQPYFHPQAGQTSRVGCEQERLGHHKRNLTLPNATRFKCLLGAPYPNSFAQLDLFGILQRPISSSAAASFAWPLQQQASAGNSLGSLAPGGFCCRESGGSVEKSKNRRISDSLGSPTAAQ